MKGSIAFATLLATFCLFGCGSPQTSTQKFSAFPIRVSDSVTARPVAGAKVYPSCMGGTPYEKNVYVTDAAGITTVVSYDSGWLGVRVEREGYKTASVAVCSTNPAVSLEKIQ